MTVLVLAGTGDGRALAGALVACGVDVLSSLAGAVRAPMLPPGRVRVGGFGGAAGFRAVLAAEGVRLIVDATHPFAAAITGRTRAIAAADAVPCLRLERPAWVAGAGDRWTEIGDAAEAAAHAVPGSTVFLATGRRGAAEFAGLGDCRVLLRVVDPPEEPFPFARGGYVIGRPPFSVESEVALFRTETVDMLVVKNAGGALAAPKLAAARTLGLPVLMLRRPASAAGETVTTVAEAVDWVMARIGRDDG